MVPSPRKLDEGRTYFENLGMEGGIVFLYSKAFTKLAQIFGLRRGPVASYAKRFWNKRLFNALSSVSYGRFRRYFR